MGDILISYGDFLENNAQLLPASYVEEIWSLQLHAKLLTLQTSTSFPTGEKISDRLIQLSKEPFSAPPTVEEAFDISRRFNIPLHPKYLFYWDCVSIDEVLLLREKYYQYQKNARLTQNNISYSSLLQIPNDDPKLKDVLEKLGIIHSVKNEGKIIEIDNLDHLYSLTKLLTPSSTVINTASSSHTSPVGDDVDCFLEAKNTLEFISKTSGIEIRAKFASSIAVRVGRPEKAAERKMKPPVHVLFPIGIKGGTTRDILKRQQRMNLFMLKLQTDFVIIANCLQLEHTVETVMLLLPYAIYA